jgi:CIC family chloride channel protein
MSGTAYGVIVDHLFGAAAGPPALYAAVAMGAVFTAAARAPLTSLASVVEMTGDFTLTLPVMLAVAIATTVSRGLSYGTIYTTKLLRRGTDLDRSTPWRALQDVKVADAMRPLPEPVDTAGNGHLPATGTDLQAVLPGPVTHDRTPQALYGTESLTEALRQLVIYGRDGLPVLSADGSAVEGWITNTGALHAIARDLGAALSETARTELETDLAAAHLETDEAKASNPLRGFRIVEITLDEHSSATGKSLGAVDWPAGHTPVSVTRRRALREADPHLKLAPGDRINLLVHTGEARSGQPAGTAHEARTV